MAPPVASPHRPIRRRATRGPLRLTASPRKRPLGAPARGSHPSRRKTDIDERRVSNRVSATRRRLLTVADRINSSEAESIAVRVTVAHSVTRRVVPTRRATCHWESLPGQKRKHSHCFLESAVYGRGGRSNGAEGGSILDRWSAEIAV